MESSNDSEESVDYTEESKFFTESNIGSDLIFLDLLQILPAIRFDAHRQRKRFFSIWKDRFPEKMDENNAIEHDRLRLLREFSYIYYDSTRKSNEFFF